MKDEGQDKLGENNYIKVLHYRKDIASCTQKCSFTT